MSVGLSKFKSKDSTWVTAQKNRRTIREWKKMNMKSQ